MAPVEQLSGIICFVEAGTLLSFTAAADKLGMTKSAVGKSVSRLEERLGVKLLHRSTRKLTLTPDGEAYLASCRHALEEIGSAESALAAKSQQLAGRLRIDAPAAWGRQILLPVLAKIVKHHPGLTLSLSLTDRIIDPIEEGVDLAIRFGETKSTTGLITRKLTEQRALIVASPGYLKSRGSPETIEALQEHDCSDGTFRMHGGLERRTALWGVSHHQRPTKLVTAQRLSTPPWQALVLPRCRVHLSPITLRLDALYQFSTHSPGRRSRFRRSGPPQNNFFPASGTWSRSL
jgi:DNA-binding transcriptional LysR family regulator